ncbi:hypothetical protein [Aggregatibacter actinomycetemcomitans]|uniref:hypothetical protein n=1 Tax=Aggregatibacter actinomycetemcomitans TaxID=714 RepID=UPI001652A444|nr:hypothetical protein [Aggregatibacter actinomycetemcomitans]
MNQSLDEKTQEKLTALQSKLDRGTVHRQPLQPNKQHSANPNGSVLGISPFQHQWSRRHHDATYVYRN